MTNPIATITLDDGRSLTVELRPDVAPNTVANFVKLANAGFFDGIAFIRCESILAQAGPASDHVGDWMKSPGYELPSECAAGGHDNPLGFERGTIGMALGSAREVCSAGVWFIMKNGETPSDYAAMMPAFGQVTQGIEIIDELCASETVKVLDTFEKAVNPVGIASVRVDTRGEGYGEPRTVPDGTAGRRELMNDPEALKAAIAQMRERARPK